MESCNVNFLFGSGLSIGVLDTLGDIEDKLTKAEEMNNENKSKIISALFWIFFKKSIYPIKNIDDHTDLKDIKSFLGVLKNILENRVTINSYRQINIFTTNYDSFIEISLENLKVEYNDGFSGRINPYFDTSNYNKIYYQQSIFSDRKSEIPVFNLFKLHGSITWELKKNKVYYCDYIDNISVFNDTYNDHMPDDINLILDDEVNEDLIPKIKFKNEFSENTFLSDYKQKFKIVNPTKHKFEETVFDNYYHELLRIYSNELEKRNTVLFVFGFSFRDEHIKEITKRSLNNPTLQVIIFSYDERSSLELEKMFDENRNVKIFKPDKNKKIDLIKLKEIFSKINEET
jgi:hypothetical protein